MAHAALVNVLLDVRVHGRPPEVLLHSFCRLEEPSVSSYGRVVSFLYQLGPHALRNDPPVEVAAPDAPAGLDADAHGALKENHGVEVRKKAAHGRLVEVLSSLGFEALPQLNVVLLEALHGLVCLRGRDARASQPCTP